MDISNVMIKVLGCFFKKIIDNMSDIIANKMDMYVILNENIDMILIKNAII